MPSQIDFHANLSIDCQQKRKVLLFTKLIEKAGEIFSRYLLTIKSGMRKHGSFAVEIFIDKAENISENIYYLWELKSDFYSIFQSPAMNNINNVYIAVQLISFSPRYYIVWIPKQITGFEC